MSAPRHLTAVLAGLTSFSPVVLTATAVPAGTAPWAGTPSVAPPTLPSIFGPAYDLDDTNPSCDANVGQANQYGTANPPCAGG